VTVKLDLQKAVAAAESAQGTYLMFAQSTQDQTAKSMYQGMAADVTRHLGQIRDRLSFLDQATAPPPISDQQPSGQGALQSVDLPGRARDEMRDLVEGPTGRRTGKRGAR